MSLVLALVSVLVSPADACAMPHEMLAVAEANRPTAPTSLADVFAEIDGVEADARAKESVKKALENAAAVQAQSVIPEAAAPTPVARPST
ncbi:MAG: hypothetical protein FJ090_16760 [Deltaproteobacteria bacterium]|nr:hypothetical protein [Deltaproteobacteria bacterium]